jgi:hypothetical protein
MNGTVTTTPRATATGALNEHDIDALCALAEAQASAPTGATLPLIHALCPTLPKDALRAQLERLDQHAGLVATRLLTYQLTAAGRRAVRAI